MFHAREGAVAVSGHWQHWHCIVGLGLVIGVVDVVGGVVICISVGIGIVDIVVVVISIVGGVGEAGHGCQVVCYCPVVSVVS